MAKKKKYIRKTTKNTKPQVSTEKTHIVCVLDSSGSMASTIDEARNGFNEYVKKQRKVEGVATLTAAMFDEANNYEVLYNNLPLNKVRDVTNEDWYPRGMTALYDAIGRTATSVKRLHEKMSKKDRPDKVLFIIVTDGHENNSKEYTEDSVKTLITDMEDNHNWKFVYLGADPTEKAVDAGIAIGVAAGNTLTFMNTTAGTGNMYATLDSATTNYRGIATSDLTTGTVSIGKNANATNTLMADVTDGKGEVGEEEDNNKSD